MTEKNDFEKRIKEIIVEKAILEINSDDLKSDTPLNEGDFALDSVQALEVLVGLEEEFDFFFDDEDVTPELFASAESLTNYVEKALVDKETAVPVET